MEGCIFCRIIQREIPSRILYESEDVIAFEDINPQAPTHILIVPRSHIPTLNEATKEDQSLLGLLLLTAARIASDRQINSSGYRLVCNTNRGAGQSVYHIHLHLLGGRVMSWPPG